MKPLDNLRTCKERHAAVLLFTSFAVFSKLTVLSSLKKIRHVNETITFHFI